MEAPTKLSDALELAAMDVEVCAAMPGVTIDMNVVHFREPAGCRMCAAGAMLHRHCDFGWASSEVFDGEEFHSLRTEWQHVAFAVDYARTSNIEQALAAIGGNGDLSPAGYARIVALGIPHNPVTAAQIRSFCSKFRRAAAILREEGL